jgi:hypothetical protein
MRHQARARRETHALKPPVAQPDEAEGHRRRTESKQDVHHGRANQARHHQFARVGAVAEEAVEEFGQAVEQAVQRDERAEHGVVKVQLMLHHRLRHAEILADEIKGRVTGDCQEQHPFPPVAELGANFAGAGHGGRNRRVGLENGENGVNDNRVRLEALCGLSTRIKARLDKAMKVA